MKKHILFAAIALSAFLTGCDKTTLLTEINVDIPYSSEFNMPQVSGYTAGVPLPAGGLKLNIPAVGFATNAQTYISANKTSADKINKVDLKSLNLRIVLPSGSNFNFVDSVWIYISAKSQPEQLVAYKYGVEKGQSAIDMYTLTDVNLKNYFIQDSISFRLSTHINATPDSTNKFGIGTIFHMNANPLN